MSVRKAIELIEFDIDYCANTYSVAPCTASIPATGDRKCTNCLADCQDPDNYLVEVVTLRFAKPADYLAESGIDVVAAAIQSIDFAPAILDPGETLGTRASIRVSFREFKHSDTGPGYDKYWDERPYDPYGHGDHWSRFRARQPYLKGEPLRWRMGFLGDALEDFETRHFIVESFDGPSPEGVYTLVAKDPLKLLDGDRAHAPGVSTGKLSAPIDTVDTAATLEPAGIGNAEYPASGYANIGGKEIVAFTRSGDSLTLTRAQFNTEATEHDDEERVQLCLDYTSESPADIIYDLMVNYGGVTAGWIDLPSWQEEVDTYFGRNFTTLIAEPTPVKQLIDEVIEQAGLVIWWDDLNEAVRLQVLRQIPTSAAVFDDSVVRKKTLKVTEQPNTRVSQSWCRFALNNPLLSLEEEFNFRSWEVGIDADNQARYGSPAVATIFSRWIPIGGRTTAQRANDLKIGRYTDPPRKLGFSVFRSTGSTAPQLGGGYLLEARVLQDATGAREQVPVQVVSVRPTAEGWDVEALEMRYTQRDTDDQTLHSIVIDVDENNINLKTVHDNLYADAVAGDTVSCIIGTDVVIGSDSTSLPAFDVDSTWPSVAATGDRTSASPVLSNLSIDTGTEALAPGMFVRGTGIPNGAKIFTVDSVDQVTLDQGATSTGTGGSLTFYTVMISVTVRGRIQGAGGKGGNGANGVGDVNATPGLPGGTALYDRYPIDLILDEGAGDIHSGGGGGGGTGCRNPDDHHGGGGGGGAGSVGGLGGSGPQEAEDGNPGTLDAGGTGGRAWTSNSFFALPSFSDDFRGGTGGGPGLAGAAGEFNSDLNRGLGGAAGTAIDGVSYTLKTGTGDIRGGQTN